MPSWLPILKVKVCLQMDGVKLCDYVWCFSKESMQGCSTFYVNIKKIMYILSVYFNKYNCFLLF